jgi:carbonic anhydrase/acetyltransferase-like protein (isoleucine patch superfamily)
MNAVIMDRVVVEDECIIGALAFVPADSLIQKRSVVVGNPAKVVKEVSDEMINWKTEGTRIYQQLPAECFRSLKPCEPLREIPSDRKVQSGAYKTWNQSKSSE